MSEIDKSEAIVEEKNDKISELEQKLKSFEEAEAKREAEAKAAEEKSIQERLDAADAKNKEIEESFNKKLDDIKMRASTTGNPNEKTPGLTKEEYLANREKYDTMYLKATLPDVYNK